MAWTSRIRNLGRALDTPVDNASLVVFRVTFGLLMFWNTVRYLLLDRVDRYFLEPRFHFKYFGFEWVTVPPAPVLYAVFVAMALLALMVAAGCFYRWSMALFGLGFTYSFLLEQARYLNHYYLLCLLCLLLVFVPAHRVLSVDVLRRPELRSRTAPGWAVWILRAQLSVVYLYAGIAKLNPDWLRGEPMTMWLAGRGDLPLLGPWLATPLAGFLFSYGGLLLDLAIAPLLLWPRTRRGAFLLAVGFHLANALLFRIGVFPFAMIAATTIFFRPDWPREFLRLAPVTAAATPQLRGFRWHHALLAGYLGIQLLVPLRHFLYPGNVSWTEEGHAFAWHMKLRNKSASTVFVVRDPESQATWMVDPATELTDWQARKMSGRPDMILQFAHDLAARKGKELGHPVEVRVRTEVALNGRRPQKLIDSQVDLAREPRTIWPASYLLPLSQPLPTRRDPLLR